MNRCDDLVRLYTQLKTLQNSGVAVQPSQDILRAAIVLSVAAFDAYATDCFCEKFVWYIQTHRVDDSIIKLLQKSGFDVSYALDLIANASRPYRKLRTLIERYYAKYTTQKLTAINGIFLQYRLHNFTFDAANRIVSITPGIRIKDPKRLLSSVEKIVNRRHIIVHDGDYNDHSRINEVTEADLKRIGHIKLLVEGMDSIIEDCSSRWRRINPT